MLTCFLTPCKVTKFLRHFQTFLKLFSQRSLSTTDFPIFLFSCFPVFLFSYLGCFDDLGDHHIWMGRIGLQEGRILRIIIIHLYSYNFIYINIYKIHIGLFSFSPRKCKIVRWENGKTGK